jgi:hypothetical protein
VRETLRVGIAGINPNRPPSFNSGGIKLESQERIELNKKLLSATQRLLDLKTEKKNSNKEINDQIHKTEEEIKGLVKEV